MCNDRRMTQPPLMGSIEACGILGIDRSTITRWVASGRIAAHKMPGKSGAFLFDPAEVERVRAEAENSVADAVERERADSAP